MSSVLSGKAHSAVCQGGVGGYIDLQARQA
jgi:hypothetical protein